jgi:hypothetical protein
MLIDGHFNGSKSRFLGSGAFPAGKGDGKCVVHASNICELNI